MKEKVGKRAPHLQQKHPLEGVGGIQFMEGLADSVINLGPRPVMDFEFILITEITKELFQV